MTQHKVPSEQHDFQSYPHWNVIPPPLPPRSRLFQLAPIGVGSVEVESLTSYIARLAAEHCVSPRKLLCKEVLAQAGRYSPFYSTSPLFYAHTINGISSLAEIAVTGFEQLTTRCDLRYSTFLIWRQVLSPLRLLRTRHAWCAYCYEEQLAERGYVYEPLIWSIEGVSICYKHHTLLCNVCPHCGRQLTFLATNYHPGYCSRCQQWLGSTNVGKLKQPSPVALNPTELAKQSATINVAGKLLSLAPHINSLPTPQIFFNNLTGIIGESAGNSVNLFSDLVGVWSGKIRRLLSGQTRPGIDVLCHLCIKLNLSPIDLLCKKEGESAPENPESPHYKDTPPPKLTTPWEEVEFSLRAALEEDPPPSLEATARHLGYYPPRLKRYFPILCEQIASRYKNHIKSKHPDPRVIKKIFRVALKEQPPPSLQSVLRSLGCRDTGYYYYSNYFDFCTAIAKRYKGYRNKPFDKILAEEHLTAALTEEPAPSFSSVAKRLGHSREFFRQKYPKLVKAIAARHMHYRKSHQEEKSEKLRRLIRKAIKKTLASKLNPSEARIREELRQHQFSVGRMILFKQALLEVKSEMGIGK